MNINSMYLFKETNIHSIQESQFNFLILPMISSFLLQKKRSQFKPIYRRVKTESLDLKAEKGIRLISGSTYTRVSSVLQKHIDLNINCRKHGKIWRK